MAITADERRSVLGFAMPAVAECRTCRSFALTLASFGKFNHGKGHYTVWLKPEPEEPLAELHTAVWTAVWNGGLVPRCTLSTCITALRRAWPMASKSC